MFWLKLGSRELSLILLFSLFDFFPKIIFLFRKWKKIYIHAFSFYSWKFGKSVKLSSIIFQPHYNAFVKFICSFVNLLLGCQGWQRWPKYQGYLRSTDLPNLKHSSFKLRIQGGGGGILLTNCQHQHLYCTHRKVNRMLSTPYSVHVYK